MESEEEQVESMDVLPGLGTARRCLEQIKDILNVLESPLCPWHGLAWIVVLEHVARVVVSTRGIILLQVQISGQKS
jgi:hypothetical protein